jgi:peroxiredoxin
MDKSIAQGNIWEYNRTAMKNNSVLAWRVLIIIVALAGLGWLQWSRVPTDAESASRIAAARVNFPAPDFVLDTLDGKRVAWDDLRGKVVLVNFWATWCPPCRAEASDLQAAYQAHRNSDFVLLGIDNAEDDADVKKFVDEFHLTFPILLDRDLEVSQRFQVMALPTSFIVDRDGIIRVVNVGGMDRAYIEAQLSNLGMTR